jgi:hypothetical protein
VYKVTAQFPWKVDILVMISAAFALGVISGNGATSELYGAINRYFMLIGS